MRYTYGDYLVRIQHKSYCSIWTERVPRQVELVLTRLRHTVAENATPCTAARDRRAHRRTPLGARHYSWRLEHRTRLYRGRGHLRFSHFFRASRRAPAPTSSFHLTIVPLSPAALPPTVPPPLFNKFWMTFFLGSLWPPSFSRARQSSSRRDTASHASRRGAPSASSSLEMSPYTPEALTLCV